MRTAAPLLSASSAKARANSTRGSGARCAAQDAGYSRRTSSGVPAFSRASSPVRASPISPHANITSPARARLRLRSAHSTRPHAVTEKCSTPARARSPPARAIFQRPARSAMPEKQASSHSPLSRPVSVSPRAKPSGSAPAEARSLTFTARAFQPSSYGVK